MSNLLKFLADWHSSTLMPCERLKYADDSISLKKPHKRWLGKRKIFINEDAEEFVCNNGSLHDLLLSIPLGFKNFHNIRNEMSKNLRKLRRKIAFVYLLEAIF